MVTIPSTRYTLVRPRKCGLRFLRLQRNFEPMRKPVEGWQRSELTDITAKVVIYEAFVWHVSRY